MNVTVMWRFLLGACELTAHFFFYVGKPRNNHAENIRRHRTKFGRSGDQASGSGAPLELPRSQVYVTGPHLGQVNPIRIYPTFELHLNFIVLSTSKYSKWSLPLSFSVGIFLCISYVHSACCMALSSHCPRFLSSQ